MDTMFLICAIVGATLLVCELAASSLGFAIDHDIDTDVDHLDGHGNWLFGVLSVRTATSSLLFFGLGGLSARYYGAEELPALGVAFGAGALALYLVALVINSFKRLKADGTVRIERAVGCSGVVYLRIPGGKVGAGKVQLSLQNRTVEYQAITAGEEIPTGKPIKVIAVVNADTVEVEQA